MASQRNGMPANDSPPPSPRVKAVVFDRYGAAEVLRAIDLPMPQAGPGEIRVRVRAAGVRPSDIALRSGLSAGAHGGARARSRTGSATNSPAWSTRSAPASPISPSATK